MSTRKKGGQRLKLVPPAKKQTVGWLIWLEMVGHGLMAIFVIALVINRFNSLFPLAIYVVVQLVVMWIDRFRTWHAWPFILRDWRERGYVN